MIKTERGFWEDLGVYFSKFEKNWDKEYKRKCEHALNSLDEKSLDELSESFNLKIASSEKKEKINEIINSKFSFYIWLLVEFHKCKIITITEYSSTKDIALKYPEINSKTTPIGKLSLLYIKQKDILREINVLFHRRELPSGRKHRSAIPILKNHVFDLLTRKRKILKYLNKLDRDKFKWKFYHETILDDTIILMFLRQIEDSIIKDIDRDRKRRTAISGFIEFHLNSKDVFIACSRYKDYSALSRGLTKFLFPIPENDDFFGNVNDQLYQKFSEGLCSDNDQKDMKVVDIVFPQTELDGARLHLTDTSRKNGLANAISALIQSNKITIRNLYDIKSLKIRFQDRTKSVIRYSSDGKVELRLNDRGLDDEQLKAFEEEFKKVFGFPLNLSIEHPKRDSIETILYEILTKKLISRPNENKLGVIKQLESENIISCKQRFLCVCEHDPINHNNYYDNLNDACRSCGAKIHAVETQIVINTSEDHVRGFLKNLLKQEGVHCEEPIYTHKKEIIRLISTSHLNLPCYIYVSTTSMPKKTIDFLVSLGKPLLVVNVGSGSVSRRIQEYNLFTPISLNEILIQKIENKLHRDFFREKISTKSKLLSDVIAKASNSSFNRLDESLSKNTPYTENDFEDDCFNVLRRVFPMSEKLGKKYSNKRLPDGISGISVNGIPMGCFAWDCKLAKEREDDKVKPHKFSTAEKRAGAEYVKRLCENKAIMQYKSKKRLDAFLIISNGINEKNFNNYAQELSKVEYNLKARHKWRGKILYLPADVLIYLYGEYNTLSAKPNFNQDLFQKLLTTMFLKKTRMSKNMYYEFLKKGHIDEIILKYNAALTSNPDITAIVRQQ